jgi:hypothetical protein
VIAGGNNPFPVGNEESAGNNPVPVGTVPVGTVPVGTEEIGVSNNLGETDLLQLLDQLPVIPMIFPGQPVPSDNQVQPPFSGYDGDTFRAFGQVFARESSPDQFPIIFPGQFAPPANQVVPPFSGYNGDTFRAFGQVFARESSPDQFPIIFPGQFAPPANQFVPPDGFRSFGVGGTEPLRNSVQRPMTSPRQPASSVNQVVGSFSGGSNGEAFRAFSEVFLKDSSGGN